MCSWLEATSVSHKEAAINIHSEVAQKYTASTTVAEAFSGHAAGAFPEKGCAVLLPTDPAIYTMKGR